MVMSGGCSGWGQWAWAARLTCHLDILRLSTRGAERWRRAGVRRSSSRRRKARQWRSGGSGGAGGGSALLGDGLACDAQRGGETDAVGVVSGMFGGLGHQGADGVVAAQVSPDFLEDQVGGFRAQHDPWPALVGFEFVEGVLDLPALG